MSAKESHQRIHALRCHLHEVQEQVEIRTVVSSGVGELMGREKGALSEIVEMFCILTGVSFMVVYIFQNLLNWIPKCVHFTVCKFHNLKKIKVNLF